MRAANISKPSIIVFAVVVIYAVTRRAHHIPTTLSRFNTSSTCLEFNIKNHIANDWKMWQRFAYLVNKCAPSLHETRLESFANSDELKYHFMPIEKLSKCSILSLGIGKDVKAEKRMKSVLPYCQFFGADPIAEDNDELFSEIGHFYNMAVGDRNGSFRSYVLEDIYRYQEVAYIDLASFIKQNIKENVVDQIMMDIEHAEFPVLPFFENNGTLDNDDIHVCQINIEIHLPEEKELTLFSQFIHRNFQSRRWIFINSEVHPILGHIRLFMINGQSEICRRRYFRQQPS